MNLLGCTITGRLDGIELMITVCWYVLHDRDDRDGNGHWALVGDGSVLDILLLYGLHG